MELSRAELGWSKVKGRLVVAVAVAVGVDSGSGDSGGRGDGDEMVGSSSRLVQPNAPPKQPSRRPLDISTAVSRTVGSGQSECRCGNYLSM